MRTRTLRSIAALALAPLLLCARAEAQEARPSLTLRFHPDRLYVNDVSPEHDLADAMLHEVAAINAGPGPVDVESARIDLLAGERVTQSQFVDTEELRQAAATWHGYDEAGVLKLYDMHFQTSRLLGDAVPGASPRLAPGEALVLGGRPLLFRDGPDSVRVTFVGKDAAGQSVEASASVELLRYRSPNRHSFPLDGTWFVAAGPNLQDHHRWAVMEEFALDIARIGAGGRIYADDPRRPDAYYGYGAEVRATAEGEVVAVENGAPEAVDRLPREGESAEAFAARTRAEQAALVRENYLAPLGNYVTIRHAGGEYGHYAHLATQSVTVHPGEVVHRGQVIGRVGQSGNSEAPHLHFQITDGADPMYSRGLPVVFDDVEVEIFGYRDRPLQSGWSVTSRR